MPKFQANWKGFDEWCEEVDEIIMKKFGLDKDSFEDFLWNECFKAGMTPYEAYLKWYKERPDLNF